MVLGAGGVRIGPGSSGTVGAGDQTKNIQVADCVIQDGGHIHREGCGVLLQAASDCVVTHNSIGNLYYTGVSMGWTWNYILTGACVDLRGRTQTHTHSHTQALPLVHFQAHPRRLSICNRQRQQRGVLQ